MSNTKIWAISLFGLAIGWVLLNAATALKPVLIAIIVSYLLNPAVIKIQKEMKVSKAIAIAVVFVLIVLLFIIVGNLLLPPVINQASTFVMEFQTFSKNYQDIIDSLQNFLMNLGLSERILEDLDQALGQLYNWLGNILVSVISSALGYIFKVVDGLIIAVLVCYFLASGKEMVGAITEHAPFSLRQPIQNLLKGTDHVIWSYLKTQFLIALIIGIISTIVFMVIGIRFAFLLGMMAGILNLIPYFGSIIAGVLAALVALLTGGVKQAIFTGIAVLIIQQIEGNLITPRLQGKSSGLHPVIIIITLLVCNYFWGTVGMFVAVPVAGLVKLILAESIQLIKDIK